uniref:Uncharacterized protein n=1 Tax=Arundo donax TaxID=35708 RepID=A0A0A9CKS0_ARUDO
MLHMCVFLKYGYVCLLALV